MQTGAGGGGGGVGLGLGGSCVGASELAADDWRRRAQELRQTVRRVGIALKRFERIPNRALFYDLHPYFSDLQSVLIVVCAYVSWLGSFQSHIPLPLPISCSYPGLLMPVPALIRNSFVHHFSIGLYLYSPSWLHLFMFDME